LQKNRVVANYYLLTYAFAGSQSKLLVFNFSQT
jgi:hypothetical protein